MKITELHLTNFINHADTKINFARVNVFVGPNGAGKTTILNGIEWALTGSCRGMAKRKDHAGVIRHGAKSAEAWLEFITTEKGALPPYYIDRRCTPSNTTLVFGRGESVIARGLQDAQAKIYDVLGITLEIAEYLFDVFALPEMPDVARKKVIQSVMAGEGTDALVNYLEEKGFGELPRDHLDAIIGAYRDHGLGNDNKGAYGYAVQMRRAYKGQLNDLVKPEPLAAVDGDFTVPGLNKAIAEAEGKRDELLRVKAYDAGQVDSTKESMRLMGEEIAKVQGQIEEMGDVEGHLKEAEERLKRAQQMLTGLTRDKNLHSDDNETARLKASVHQLGTMGNAISQKSLKAVGARLNLLELEAKKKDDGNQSGLDACEKAVAEAAVARNILDASVATFNRLIAQNEQNNRILEGLKADLANAESQKDSGLSPEQLAEKVGALEHEIGLYRTRLEQLTRYDEHQRSLEGVRKQEQALAKRVASWDKLAEALNPKNPDLKILMGTTFGTFQELFRSAATGLGVPATVNDEDFSIEVTRGDSISPVAWLSHSEVYRVGIALEMALCSILGIQTVIIDEGEILFDECKQDLSGLISAPSNYIDCFVLLATGAPQPHGSGGEVVVHGVRDGKVLDA